MAPLTGFISRKGLLRAALYTSVMLCACAALAALSGCGYLPPSRPVPTAEQAPLFSAPTRNSIAAATEALTELAPSEPAALDPSQVPGCKNELKYLEDLTIPDGMQLDANKGIEKEWRVKNNGSCNWLASYTLRLVSGSELGAASTQPLVPAPAGTEAVIRIPFTTPAEAGIYEATWQAYGANDQPFGEVLTIKIAVTSP